MTAIQGKQELRLKVVDVNPHITCGLCAGYFVNATTITECMHTFCKSCLILHLKVHNTCPVCRVVIHPSQPLRAVRADQTLQEIVFKLVPGLRENEKRREAEFNAQAGEAVDEKIEEKRDVDVDYIKRTYSKGITDMQHICMESASNQIPSLDRKFMMVPRRATVLHLKKFVAAKILNDADRWDNVNIYCDGELQGKEHSIEFVFATVWKKRSPILVVQYSCQIPS